MIDLLAEAAALQDFLEQTGWDFYFIGALRCRFGAKHVLHRI